MVSRKEVNRCSQYFVNLVGYWMLQPEAEWVVRMILVFWLEQEWDRRILEKLLKKSISTGHSSSVLLLYFQCPWYIQSKAIKYLCLKLRELIMARHIFLPIEAIFKSLAKFPYQEEKEAWRHSWQLQHLKKGRENVDGNRGVWRKIKGMCYNGRGNKKEQVSKVLIGFANNKIINITKGGRSQIQVWGVNRTWKKVESK